MKKSGGRRWILGTFVTILGLFVLLLLLSLSRTPSTPVSRPPASADVNAARSVYGRVRAAQSQPGAHRVEATWAELDAVAALGGRALGVDRVSFDRDGERGRLNGSVPLPLGFWLNGRAWLTARDDHSLQVSGRIGHLPVPAFVAHGLIELSRRILLMRGAEIPPLVQIVNSFTLDDKGLGAVVDIPNKSRIFAAMSDLRSGSIDAARVETHYCRLVERQKAEAVSDMAMQVRRLFGSGEGSVEDNRAAFVALALFVAATDVGSLSGGPKDIFARCGKANVKVELLGREDLVKHWAVSAALTSTFGQQASISLGTWKEVSDSGAGGSGFSLVDLAADRSGTFSAVHGTDEEKSEAVRNWLSAATQADLLPVSALALAEGMTEPEFNSHYTSTDSSEFALTVQRIDATLAVLSRF